MHFLYIYVYQKVLLLLMVQKCSNPNLLHNQDCHAHWMGNGGYHMTHPLRDRKKLHGFSH